MRFEDDLCYEDRIARLTESEFGKLICDAVGADTSRINYLLYHALRESYYCYTVHDIQADALLKSAQPVNYNPKIVCLYVPELWVYMKNRHEDSWLEPHKHDICKTFGQWIGLMCEDESRLVRIFQSAYAQSGRPDLGRHLEKLIRGLVRSTNKGSHRYKNHTNRKQ